MTKLLIIISLIIGGIYGAYSYGKVTSYRAFVIGEKAEIIKKAEAKESIQTNLPTDKEVINEILAVFGKEPTKVKVEAIKCAYSESKLKYDATNYNNNGTIDRGIFQINSIHNMTERNAYDFRQNIKKAYEIWKRNGWKSWFGKDCK